MKTPEPLTESDCQVIEDTTLEGGSIRDLIRASETAVNAKWVAMLSEQEPVAWLFTNVQSGDIEASTNPDWHECDVEMWHRQELVIRRHAPAQQEPMPLATTCHCACVFEEGKLVELCKMHAQLAAQQESELRDAVRQVLGWTLPDAVRKILEKGIWAQPAQQREWVGLTGDEKSNILAAEDWGREHTTNREHCLNILNAANNKLREKNRG